MLAIEYMLTDNHQQSCSEVCEPLNLLRLNHEYQDQRDKDKYHDPDQDVVYSVDLLEETGCSYSYTCTDYEDICDR